MSPWSVLRSAIVGLHWNCLRFPKKLSSCFPVSILCSPTSSVWGIQSPQILGSIWYYLDFLKVLMVERKILLGGSKVPGDLLLPMLLPLLVWGQAYDLFLQGGGSGVYGGSILGLSVVCSVSFWNLGYIIFANPVIPHTPHKMHWKWDFLLFRLSRQGKGHAHLIVSVCLPVPFKTIHNFSFIFYWKVHLESLWHILFCLAIYL